MKVKKEQRETKKTRNQKRIRKRKNVVGDPILQILQVIVARMILILRMMKIQKENVNMKEVQLRNNMKKIKNPGKSTERVIPRVKIQKMKLN